MATEDLIRLSIFIFVALFGKAVSVIQTIKVGSVEVVEMPYRLEDAYLIGLPLIRRRELCAQTRNEIDEFVFPEKPNSYVPVAHKFKFDSEDWLAIRCPSFPPIYISHEWVEKSTRPDNHQWYVRMVKPPFLDDYKFNLETATNISTAKDDDTIDQKLKLRSQTSIFNALNRKMRWHICNEARKRVRYEFNPKIDYRTEPPRFYELTYEDGTKETIFAIRCFRTPEFYLHTEHDHLFENKIITMALIHYNNESYEMNPSKNVVPVQ